MSALDRAEYAARYGPTTGDRVRLADTGLWVEVEADDVAPGDELIGGCGKTLRDGVLATARSGRDSALDMIIPNVLVLDPVLGRSPASSGSNTAQTRRDSSAQNSRVAIMAGSLRLAFGRSNTSGGSAYSSFV